jgi:hypothetical protein
MSLRKTFGEYLEMVKNGFKNKDKIIEAMQVSAMIKNGLVIGDGLEVTNEAIAEILKRIDICAECPFNSRHAKKGSYTSTLPFEHCTLCKCRIGYDDSKEYCLSCNCGAEAWNEMNPDMEPMEVKWTAFKN